MKPRHRHLILALLLVGSFLFLEPRVGEAHPKPAPEYTRTFGLIPGSGPAGMMVSAVGGG